MTELIMLSGFILAAYSIVANDAIQTLGTFLSSNASRPWWVLWLFCSLVLVVVVLYGWTVNGGDPAYGRLERFPQPAGGLQLFHLIPPIVILVLTRMGVPVSTTFLVLAFFNFDTVNAMLLKSLSGYLLAFVVAILVYRFVIKRTTAYFAATRHLATPRHWIVLQWLSTAFLWSQWLIQDLANIFVYFPRVVTLDVLVVAICILVLLQGLIFYQMGGPIQRIVTTKTGTSDIRAATIIDILFAVILLIFKEWSNIPMSTTWVFLGLLAGRQLAISLHLYEPSLKESKRLITIDIYKALTGLVISLCFALSVPVFFTA